MKLYSFEDVGGTRGIGAERDGALVDLSATDSRIPSSMLELIRAGEPAMKLVKAAVAGKAAKTRAFAEVRLLAPVPRPGKILSSGNNYYGHLDEEPGAKKPDEPFFFSKIPTCVVGPGDAIIHPRLTRQLDYEVELAVVIGRTMRNTPEEEIFDCIFGYTIHHDVSARDVQLKDSQITLGKNFDTFAPMGPCIATPESIPDPSNLRLQTFLNGKQMQDSSTSDWIFPLPILISSLTNVMTLEPGDIISTGCPAGVGLYQNPQIWLQPGDVVELEIQGIGRLKNHVIAEDTEGIRRGR
jgi:2-keto-4-pentenoate hydratase/2-oxohepta-3-ene-1,7-dioic acid hydratase in catechol pathway